MPGLRSSLGKLRLSQAPKFVTEAWNLGALHGREPALVHPLAHKAQVYSSTAGADSASCRGIYHAPTLHHTAGEAWNAPLFQKSLIVDFIQLLNNAGLARNWDSLQEYK
jgi:hypothetical protein